MLHPTQERHQRKECHRCVPIPVSQCRGTRHGGRCRGHGTGMAHEIAKLLLEKAGTLLERTEAIRTALSLGMPIREIEDYLDWVEYMRSTHANHPAEKPEQRG
jgi:hypothetical protein